MSIQDDINRLIQQPLRDWEAANSVFKDRDPISSSSSVSESEPQSQSSSGGGIASPLTETSRTTSLYTIPVPYSSGVITVSLIKAGSITFNDANGDTVVINFA